LHFIFRDSLNYREQQPSLNAAVLQRCADFFPKNFKKISRK